MSVGQYLSIQQSKQMVKKDFLKGKVLYFDLNLWPRISNRSSEGPRKAARDEGQALCIHLWALCSQGFPQVA